jgi:VCBS repeat-containing protein
MSSTNGGTPVIDSPSTLTNGVGPFSVVLTLATNAATLTATSDVPALSVTTNPFTVNPGSADHLVVSGYPSPTQVGVSHNVTVTAKDQFENINASYAGVVTLSSTPPGAASVPAPTGLVAGTGSFAVTFNVVGLNRAINATDGSISGSQTPISVEAGPPPPPQRPIAIADTYVVKQGSSLTVDATKGVLANDTDVDTAHSALTAHGNTTPSHGTLALAADGSFVYTPTPSYVGPDSFTYRASDGSLDSTVVTVSINVYLNHAPIAVSDVITVVAGSPATPADVLANDNAINQDTGEALSIVAVTSPAHGATAVTGGGSAVTYRPASGFTGTDLFSYTISDGQFQATASVLVKVPRDTFGPTATRPVQVVPAQSIGTSTLSVRLTWSATDRGSGVARYQLQQSTNGGAYSAVSLSRSLAKATSRTLSVGSTCRFRVRATDKRGNVGAWAYGPAFRVLRPQETSASFSGAWTASSSASYSGGTVRSTATAGDAATFSATARTLAWVAVRGPGRGLAQVFIDGLLATTLDLSASSTIYRTVVFARTFATSASHTLRVVHVGSPTTKIDVDAFVVLR